MKYSAVTWHVMSRRVKIGLEEYWQEEPAKELLKRI